jgi:hypothetical protein
MASSLPKKSTTVQPSVLARSVTRSAEIRSSFCKHVLHWGIICLTDRALRFRNQNLDTRRPTRSYDGIRETDGSDHRGKCKRGPSFLQRNDLFSAS